MKRPVRLFFTSVGVLSGGAIVTFCFNNVLSFKRFVRSFCYTCAACIITTASTAVFRLTPLKTFSENYHIIALLVSIAGTVGCRYELYCNKKKLMPYNIFWKYIYPWMLFCTFPSVFLCGYKNSTDIFLALERTAVISVLGIFIGSVLPRYNDTPSHVSCKVKNFFSEYTSVLITGIGCGLIISKLLTFFTNYHIRSVYPYTDLFFLGMVFVSVGFIIEDVKTLKEITEDSDEELEFDALVTSIPLYTDIILLFVFVVELTEPRCSLD